MCRLNLGAVLLYCILQYEVAKSFKTDMPGINLGAMLLFCIFQPQVNTVSEQEFSAQSSGGTTDFVITSTPYKELALKSQPKVTEAWEKTPPETVETERKRKAIINNSSQEHDSEILNNGDGIKTGDGPSDNTANNETSNGGDGCEIKNSTTVTAKNKTEIIGNVNESNNKRNETSGEISLSELHSESADKSSVIHQGTVSQETYNLILSISVPCHLVIAVVGLFFCCVSIAVFSCKHMKNPTTTYLISYNGTEATCVLLQLITEIFNLTTGDDSQYTVILRLYVQTYVIVFAERAAYWLNCLISAERFIAVTFPLKSKYFKLVNYPKVFVTVTLTSSFLLHFFVVLSSQAFARKSTDNSTIWGIRYTELYMQNTDLFAYWSLGSKILFVALPLLGSILFNVGTVVSLWKHSRLRRRLNITHRSNTSNMERQKTVTFLFSTFAFVLLVLPINIISVIGNVWQEYRPFTRHHFSFLIATRISGMLLTFTVWSSFIFYITICSQFRESVLNVLKQLKKKMARSRSTEYSVNQAEENHDNPSWVSARNSCENFA